MLAPPEGLRAPGVPGVNPGVDPRSQGMIPRRFKRKKIFVTEDARRTDGWTDRRDGRNSGLDFKTKPDITFISSNFDGWPFSNQWEFRDMMYLILKV